jgi:hypothetical protein
MHPKTGAKRAGLFWSGNAAFHKFFSEKFIMLTDLIFPPRFDKMVQMSYRDCKMIS